MGGCRLLLLRLAGRQRGPVGGHGVLDVEAGAPDGKDRLGGEASHRLVLEALGLPGAEHNRLAAPALVRATGDRRVGLETAEAELDRVEASVYPYPRWLGFAAPALLSMAVTLPRPYQPRSSTNHWHCHEVLARRLRRLRVAWGQ